ncbi:phosphoglycolate phosphatase [Xylophilus ampelinus]|uniref:Phosphoglycolate phosphatase n=1 Tax=Xylophilus ampelinus TaxID=54067 RepID=A0A318SI05_9BURK|nr:phosphoglycolate phosphatase [Xylophilus ampelinus]MCS4511848.1 phosphoglycolate phosphatase [Xylophilus ampelinus]PYE73349.1 phosphoglycolate phosphatase [Xylophilus ampelinus]
MFSNFIRSTRLSIDAAIVDLDGTLVDTLGDFEAALARMLAERGRPPLGRADLSRMVGKGSEHLVQLALEHAGLPAADAPEALARYLHHYADVNGRHSGLFPGVREGLEALRASGLPLLCLTNKPHSFARDLLEALDLGRYFGSVFGGDSFARKKPDPLPVLESCRALGTAPGRTLMLGDSRNDAQAARAAGCPVVLVTYGYNHGEPVRQVDADGFVDTLDEVAALLAAPA